MASRKERELLKHPDMPDYRGRFSIYVGLFPVGKQTLVFYFIFLFIKNLPSLITFFPSSLHLKKLEINFKTFSYLLLLHALLGIAGMQVILTRLGITKAGGLRGLSPLQLHVHLRWGRVSVTSICMRGHWDSKSSRGCCSEGQHHSWKSSKVAVSGRQFETQLW